MSSLGTYEYKGIGECNRKPFQVAQMIQSMEYLNGGGEKKPISTDHSQQLVVCHTHYLLLKLVL